MFDRVDEETFIVYQVDNMAQYMLQYIFEPHRDKNIPEDFKLKYSKWIFPNRG